MKQRRIGLTGGIGTGKSTVARYLAERYGLPILDADIYAREAVAVGSPILGAIAARYGPGAQLEDGSLDRRRIGEIVFHDPAERRWLEQQIHPYVRQRFHHALETLPGDATVVLALPLLLEAGLTGLVSEIWVVACPLAEQVARLKARDRLSDSQIVARIASQMDLEQKVAQADVVLDNSQTPEALYAQVDQHMARG